MTTTELDREQLRQWVHGTTTDPLVAANLLRHIRGAFKEWQHPRGKDGKWVKKGGSVNVLPHGGGPDATPRRGEVERLTPQGPQIKYSDGTREVVPLADVKNRVSRAPTARAHLPGQGEGGGPNLNELSDIMHGNQVNAPRPVHPAPTPAAPRQQEHFPEPPAPPDPPSEPAKDLSELTPEARNKVENLKVREIPKGFKLYYDPATDTVMAKDRMGTVWTVDDKGFYGTQLDPRHRRDINHDTMIDVTDHVKPVGKRTIDPSKGESALDSVQSPAEAAKAAEAASKIDKIDGRGVVGKSPGQQLHAQMVKDGVDQETLDRLFDENGELRPLELGKWPEPDQIDPTARPHEPAIKPEAQPDALEQGAVDPHLNEMKVNGNVSPTPARKVKASELVANGVKVTPENQDKIDKLGELTEGQRVVINPENDDMYVQNPDGSLQLVDNEGNLSEPFAPPPLPPENRHTRRQRQRQERRDQKRRNREMVDRARQVREGHAREHQADQRRLREERKARREAERNGTAPPDTSGQDQGAPGDNAGNGGSDTGAPGGNGPDAGGDGAPDTGGENKKKSGGSGKKKKSGGGKSGGSSNNRPDSSGGGGSNNRPAPAPSTPRNPPPPGTWQMIKELLFRMLTLNLRRRTPPPSQRAQARADIQNLRDQVAAVSSGFNSRQALRSRVHGTAVLAAVDPRATLRERVHGRAVLAAAARAALRERVYGDIAMAAAGDKKPAHSMKDGSFPIPDVDHLKRAIKAHGRSKHPQLVRRHIIAAARRLRRTDLIPQGWVSSGALAASGGSERQTLWEWVHAHDEHPGLVAARIGKYLEWQHPRGIGGRWIEKGGSVDIFDQHGGGKPRRGEVAELTPDGPRVKFDDGSDEVIPLKDVATRVKRAPKTRGTIMTGPGAEARHAEYETQRSQIEAGKVDKQGRPLPVIERDDAGKIIVSDEAKRLGSEVYNRGVAAEPDISAELARMVGDTDPANYSEPGAGEGKLYGFQYRLKAESGVQEKVERNVEEDKLQREDAAKNIKDAVRYTVHFPQDEFGERTQQVLDQLAAQNDKVVVKNTWPPEAGRAYKGVNVNVWRPDGTVYEVQFHTPESQRVKDQMHGLYEDQRKTVHGSPEWQAIEDQMRTLGDDLVRQNAPRGVMDIKTPVKPSGGFEFDAPAAAPPPAA